MWLHHLLNLLAAAGSVFFDAIGTTLLGRIVDAVFGMSLAVAILHKKRREEGWRAMLSHWREEYRAGIRFTIWCVVIIYTPVACWSIGKAIYEDHQYFVGFVKKQNTTIAQHNATSQVSQAILQGQISDWRAKCSQFEGANGVLGAQNRDQQNTINNCQTQALKLLTPEPFKITALVLEPATGAIEMQHVKFLLLTNKTITPVNMMATCQRRIDSASASIVGGAMLAGGTSKVTDTQYQVNISAPAWTPESPMIFELSFRGDSNNACGFNER